MGLHDLEKAFNTDPKSLPDRITFWLDYSGNEWKDHARRSLLMASNLAEENSDIFILMENMLVHGAYGQRLYDLTRNKGIRFLRVSKRMSPPFSVEGESVKIVMEEATLGDTHITLLCNLLVIPEEVAGFFLKFNQLLAHKLQGFDNHFFTLRAGNILA